MSFLTEHAFDFQNELNVLPAIKALLVGAKRFDTLELGFPVAEYVWFQACDPADLPNPEVQFIGNVGHDPPILAP
jgi:hypothetical protein